MTDPAPRKRPRGAAAPAHGEARERLLAAAARLFARRGRDGVSVREIAAEAGVGHAGVNYHFRSKRELYREVLRRHGPGARLERVAEAPASPAAARAALVRWVRAFVADGALPDDPIVDGLVRHELERPEGPSDEVFEGVIQPKHAEVKGLIALLRPDLSADELAVAAIGVLSQGVYYRVARPVALRLLGVAAIDGELAERIVARVIDNTLGGLGLPPASSEERAG